MGHIKIRLAALNFLEFAVWGAYLVSMGIYLSGVGLGKEIFWFYTVQGLVSLFMPAIVGIVADRWVPAQKMLSLCHLLAGGFMIMAGYYCMSAGDAVGFSTLFTDYTAPTQSRVFLRYVLWGLSASSWRNCSSILRASRIPICSSLLQDACRCC